MKILNELVELANKANAAGQGTPEMVEFRVVANPDNILAIAEAFRALEQRVVVAEQGEKTFEDGFCSVRQDRDEWKQRAEAAEAKLAELEKQEPVFQVEVSGNHWLNAGPLDDSDFTGLPDGINLLFARPATHTGSIT